ncbi:hypothetical protein ASE07_10815 [Noviherbaspirillum sp. Root189]|nr:hypothetical protein ASE07_10815 [Noviherbaspirillum sp. Root189]
MLNDPNASEHAELQLETARLKEFYLTRIDRDGLVRMKSRALDFEDATLGVADTNYALALKCYQRFGDAPPVPTTCWLVEKDDDGNWSATKNGEPKELPDGDYIFVTMADGTIRLGAPENQQNAHCTLSSHAAYVKYAGTIKFREGKPIQGSSQSGTYLPNPKAWINSGFSEDILSNPEDLDYEEIERLYDQGRHPATPPSSEANLSTS